MKPTTPPAIPAEPGSTVTDAFTHGGLQAGGKAQTEFELRRASTADMIAAEETAPMERRFAYRLALAARQLVRVGELTAPISFDRVQQLNPKDVTILLEAQERVEALGNG